VKKLSLNPTGEMARWLRQNTDNPQAVKILKSYEKKFKFSDDEYKQASRLRELLELSDGPTIKKIKPGLYYKESTAVIYKVNEDSLSAKWRDASRNWWSDNADMVALSRDILNYKTTVLTLARAAEIGLKYGICCVCGRSLTEEKSLKTGIGPVCAKNLKTYE
jgi:hypothetical protein